MKLHFLRLVSVSCVVGSLLFGHLQFQYFGALAQEKLKTEVVPQVGHSIEIDSLDISRDGKWLVSGGQDHSIKLWDANKGFLLRDFRGHGQNIMSLALSPDGKHVLSGSFDTTMKVWDLASGKLVHSMAHPVPYGAVFSVAYSPNGRNAVSGNLDGKVRIWNTATGAIVRVLSGHATTVTSVTY